MSYDLMFSAGNGKKLDKKAFKAYFRDRRNYQLGEGQAIYQNEDTGVYFIFDEPDNGVVAFNLNYFRPHIFGLEAAPELEQFAEAFAAIVTDPQGEIEDPGTFRREPFLRGWNAGNQFAYRAMLKEQTGPVYTWPSQRIRAVWEWNYLRSTEQERVGENVFVPAIFVVEMSGEILSMAIWPPDCAILLPAVDAVLVPLAQAGKQSEELAPVRWGEVLPIVQPYLEDGAGLARYLLAFEKWPDQITEFLTRERSAMEGTNGIPLDQLLDQELVAEAQKS
jgi:hypothetical protein